MSPTGVAARRVPLPPPPVTGVRAGEAVARRLRPLPGVPALDRDWPGAPGRELDRALLAHPLPPDLTGPRERGRRHPTRRPCSHSATTP